MEQFSAEIALGNDLHYSQLVPQVGFHFPIQTNYGEDFAKSWPFLSVFVQSAVFTLGFTPSDRSLVGKMEKLGKSSSQLEQKLVPSFPRPGLADRGMPEGGGGGEISIQGRSQETHSDETLLTEELLFWLYVRGSFEWKKYHRRWR